MNWTVLDFSLTENQDGVSGARKYAFQAQVRKIHSFELTANQMRKMTREGGQNFCVDEGLSKKRLDTCLSALGCFSASEIEDQAALIDFDLKGVCLGCGLLCTRANHGKYCPVKRMDGNQVQLVSNSSLSTELSEAERKMRGGLVVSGVIFGFSDEFVGKAKETMDVSQMLTASVLMVKGNQELGVCSKCSSIQRFQTHGKLCGDKLTTDEICALRHFASVGLNSAITHLSGYWVTVVQEPQKQYRVVSGEVKKKHFVR